MRLIIASNENGSKEVVLFTADERTPASDLMPLGLTVDYDEVLNIDFIMPGSFPVEYILERKSLA